MKYISRTDNSRESDDFVENAISNSSPPEIGDVLPKPSAPMATFDTFNSRMTE